ncbi:MAG: CcmD family protein [Chitinophagaceae bacterium]|nr:CcmD family protein [Chitinophagaceae bacterium]
MKHIFSLISCLLLVLGVHTETAAQDMATGMRSDGKIYVVFFVLATIFAGIFVFLVYLERKIKKLESKK